MAFIDQQTVYPSNKDLAETPGDGAVGLENNVSANYFRQYQRNSFSDASAFVLSDPNTGLQVLLTGGGEGGSHAMIRGYRFIMSSTLLLKDSGNDVDVVGNIQANKYNHIFIAINRDVNLEIDKMQIVINTSGVYPAANGNSIKIGIAVTDGSEVIQIIDERQSSLCLPVFCEIPTATTVSATFIYGQKAYINVPVLNTNSVLSVSFAALGDGFPMGGNFNFEWKCEVEGPGPDGLGLTQESAVFPLTTLRGTTTIHRAFIIIDNKIGRFEGGLLKIRMAVKGVSSGTVVAMTNSSGFDMRGGHRLQNWSAKG